MTAQMPNFKLHVWKLREEDKRRQGGKLWHAGWSGYCITNMSDYERRIIDAFVKQRREQKQNVICYKEKITSDIYDDQGEKGTYTDMQYCIWIKSPDAVAEFVKMIGDFADRETTFKLTSSNVDQSIKDRLCAVNYALIPVSFQYGYPGETKQTYFSTADAESAALVRLYYGE